MPRGIRTPQKDFDKFLERLAKGDTVQEACDEAGIGRSTADDHRKADPEFAARWEEAYEAGTDVMEAEAKRRAMESSDTLMIFLLKARRPDKYRERREVLHTGDAKPLTAGDLAVARQLGQRADMIHHLEALAAALAAERGEVIDGEATEVETQQIEEGDAK